MLIGFAPVQQGPTLVTAQPFSEHTLSDGGNYRFAPIRMVPTVTPGPWLRTTNGSWSASPGNFVQWMGEGTVGWTDTIMRVNEKRQLERSRHNDPAYRLDAPWWDGTKWRDGWYRVWPSAPPGTWYNEVWPRPTLKITTSRSRLVIDVTGSPSEVEIHGSDNEIVVNIDGAAQSRLMIDRPMLRIFGDRNHVSGFVRGEMTAVRVYGNRNEIEGMSLEGLEVGNDVGLVVFGRNYEGNSLKGVFALCRQRRYPASWVHTFAYVDDNQPNVSITDCFANGFQSGAFVHGGDGTRIENLSAINCEVTAIVSPHFTTPTKRPFSKVGTVHLFGEPPADRKVPALMGNSNATYLTESAR